MDILPAGDRCDNNERNESNVDGSKTVEEPRVGMLFNSQKDVHQYYTNYARQAGFGIIKRSQNYGDDKTVRYFTYACCRSRKGGSKAKNPLKHLTIKTQCLAKIRCAIQQDGNFKLTTVTLEHNHALSPGHMRSFETVKKSNPRTKRRHDIVDQPRRRKVKSHNSSVVEDRGYESPTFGEEECQYYSSEPRRLRFGGDVRAVYGYLVRMQLKDSRFFYLMDLDEECCVRNLFWASARSRATFEAFGDVVTFDTTYLRKKYDVPFVSFVGVNHHGESVLLGCGLLANEDVETFVWLFGSWLTCMSGTPPKAIITDQCKAIQRAVEMVFPTARHGWCLWHIMNKVSEKLLRYSQFEAVKLTLQDLVHGCFTKDEFEDGWRFMIENYNLRDDEWLAELYDERNRWVPIYMRETFWAGMLTTQHADRTGQFFDGYINSKTPWEQFMEQHDKATRRKIDKENQADYQSYTTNYQCITHFSIEKQFHGAYTNTKFKEFQEELMGKIYCNPLLVKEEDSLCVYQVTDYVKAGASGRDVLYFVYFNQVEVELGCTCHLFEFKGILCRHVISVLTQRKVQRVPSRYILSRWRKDLRRKYSFFKAVSDGLSDNPGEQQHDEVCRGFYELASIAADSEEKSSILKKSLLELKEKILCV